MLKCVCISVCMHAESCVGACGCGVYMMDSICYMMCGDGIVYRDTCMCVRSRYCFSKGGWLIHEGLPEWLVSQLAS